VDGSPVFIWEQKLKRSKQAIKDCLKNSPHNPREEVEKCKKQLEELKENMEFKEINNSHISQEKEFFQKYMKALHNEEMVWRLKSRVLWLQVGDKNTSFFHKHTKARQHKNSMEEIKTRSRALISSFEEIKKATTSHFGNFIPRKEKTTKN
jgi:hypothetical protein